MPTGRLACEKNMYYKHAIKKVLKKGTYVQIENDFQNMFNFYDSLVFVMVAPTLNKPVKPDSTPTVFQLDSPNYFDGSIFVSFIR